MSISQHDDEADQLCVAWDDSGIVGIGKKVFPSNSPSDDPEGDNIACYIEDYSTIHRLISLKNGEKAVLCACYDMFGCADYGARSDTREKYIQNLCDRRGRYFYEGVQGFEHERSEAVLSFWNLLKRNKVKTAFVAIHGFTRSGSDNRWQHYGIDGAVRSLGGAVFGAAHYTDKLPPTGAKLTLTAKAAGNDYKHAAACKAEWYIAGEQALLRVFES